MTYYPNVFEAACDVMRQCLEAVGQVAFAAAWWSGDPSSASEASSRAREAEKAWQRRWILSEPGVANLAWFGLSRKGRDRRENQDAFFASPELGLFVVVDAMGSARAAAIVLSVFEEAVTNARREGRRDGVLTDAARRASAAIMHVPITEPSLRGIGAQFVALLIDAQEARVAWIGQNRCYRCREGKTERLTRDDRTLGCDGPLAGDDFGEPVLPLIHQVLGGDREVHVHEKKLSPLQAGDTYLLSSDGLHGLYEDNVHLVLDEARTLTLVRLAELLNDASDYEDDATALCVRVGSS